MNSKIKKRLISVVITGYNEEKNIAPLYKRLVAVFSKIPYNLEILYVDNSSSDKSETVLKNLSQKDKRFRVIIMSRNFGSPQPSFVAGLEYSKGDAIVLLHGDIQDPPELIPLFIKKWEMGYDIAYGIIKERKGFGPFTNFWYRLFYFLYQKLSPIHIPRDSSDFSLIDKRIKNEILKFPEKDFIFRGIRSYVGFSQIGIPYKRHPRMHGISKENFFSNIWWAKTIIFTFSPKPLSYVTRLFALVFFATLICTFLVFKPLIFGESIETSSLLFIFILISTLLNLFVLSLISEYLSIIFVEIKKRPRYIIKKKYNIK
jgi:dolichol-phosphate mannosyltransferase